MNEPTTPDVAHAQAQRALLDGLRRGDNLDDLERAVRRNKTKTFTPDVAVLQVGVAAMDLAGVDRNTQIAKADLIALHLKEINFRNQRALQERTTYALNITAAMRGGLEPDILDDMYWWHARDIVKYAVIASTAYVRACAHRRQQPIQQFVDDLQPRSNDNRSSRRYRPLHACCGEAVAVRVRGPMGDGAVPGRG